MTLDHKVPVVRGGTDNLDNLCLACGPCNTEKGDMTHREYFFYKSPFGFIMSLFFVRKMEYVLLRESISKVVSRKLDDNEEKIDAIIDDKLKVKLDETIKERDRYRNHAETLMKRILLLEQHLKVEIVDGEYKKITKKELDKKNKEKAITYEQEHLRDSMVIDPVTGETHGEMMERLALEGLSISKDN